MVTWTISPLLIEPPSKKFTWFVVSISWEQRRPIYQNPWNEVAHSHLSKVLGNVKKKTYFIKKLLWSHFWIDFNKFYTKTFGIIYILFVYLLIMFIWAVPI
jgi:hypothetical protein